VLSVRGRQQPNFFVVPGPDANFLPSGISYMVASRRQTLPSHGLICLKSGVSIPEMYQKDEFSPGVEFWAFYTPSPLSRIYEKRTST
jgi:hypothetical protein